jgi:uncharacterized protein (DUF305 family)
VREAVKDRTPSKTLLTKARQPALLLVVASLLAACGSAGGGQQGHESGDAHNKETAEKGGGTKEEMDHGAMGTGTGSRARRMVTKNGEYSDERFIDAMVPHHDGAIDMARVAEKNAEHEEVERLAGNIITTQRAEIEELESIKQEEFGTSRVPMDMSMGQMKSMGMEMDPQSLVDENPFDEAFIDAMIPHHQSAVEMAMVANQESDNPRIKDLAANIVSAQEREITQMQRWREQWYPEG